MKDKYGHDLKRGDMIVYSYNGSAPVYFGRVSETQTLNDGQPGPSHQVNVVELERRGSPRRWMYERNILKVPESILASARLMGVRPIFSDEAGK